MINLRPALAVAVIPFVIGTFGYVAPNQAIAATSRRHPQVTQQKQRLPQPHQEANRNQPRLNNR